MRKIKDDWEKMYYDRPDLYEELKSAEDKKNVILKFLLKKASFKNKAVLDVGSGTLTYPILLSKYCRKIYAIEPSQPMIDIGEKNIEKLGLKNIEAIRGKVEKIPLSSNSVDIVMSTWGFLQYSVNIKKGMKEILRVLKKHGKIFIVDTDFNGEFMEIWRKTKRNSIMGDILNRHLSLLDIHKFKKYKLKTSFDYPSVKKAAQIMGFVFGNKFRNYLVKSKKSKINMDISVFYGVK